ncbi:MAG: proteasome activator [Micromonosporaceae bacterium]
MVNSCQQAEEIRDAWPLPRVVIEVGRSARSGKTYRVEAPDRILRIFGLLTEARSELDLTAMPPETRERLQRMLEAVSAEIERSVSPPLAQEFHSLIHRGRGAQGTAELRIEYASLLGWASGLVVAMLDQLSAADAKPGPVGVQIRDDEGPTAGG